MFNSLLRDFDEDPFFSDPFRAHNEHMRQMTRSFSDPFGGHFMPSLTDGRNHGCNLAGQPGSSLALRDDHRDMSSRNPFNKLDSMMSNVKSRMEEMHKSFENMSTDPNSHSFSSSSVMTYSKVGNEQPKVFQATSTTRRAPGGIKETRRAIKDSVSGMEKLAIGHHIQDRGHVVEKKVNNKTGERELNQDFENLDESEAQSFNDEWQQELSRFQPAAPMSRLEGPRPRAVHRAAISSRPEPVHSENPKPKAEEKKEVSVNQPNVEGSSVSKQ
ncbi:myeloid leukemia factor 1 [Genypterus blacodes]|uniref:myeloid leukemia factor 1 n=1 Tax=Genypterus blacodes TaxID=154954 RepID=UPI003F75E5E0